MPPLVALVVWAVSLRGTDVRGIDDLGIVSVLRPGVLVAFAIITLSFALALRRPVPKTPVLAVHVVAFVVMLFALPSVIHEAPRYEVTWRHVGVVESVSRTGEVDPRIDAYFNWPGFFIFAAFVTEAAGLPSALELTRWAPVVFNLAYLGPLLLLFRAGTRDARIAWLAVWIFYSANWISQDYFAPQALAYFLHLTILAVVVRSFSAPGRLPLLLAGLAARLRHARVGRSERRGLVRFRMAAHGERDPSSVRAAMIAIVIVAFLAVVPSHQLTPFMTTAAAGALVAVGLSWARRLPVLMAVATGAWISFMAATYMSGHLTGLLTEVGEVERSVEANVSARISGSPEHVAVVYTRLALTGTLWIAAALGAVRALRAGRLNVAFAVLGATPFVFLALQPYGGEMLLRVYLFSLPFAAFFVASLLSDAFASYASRFRTGAAAVALGVLAGAFLIARYGNERMDYFTREEVSAVERLYAEAPNGSILVAGASNLPWKYRDYERHDYETLTETDAWERLTETATSVAPVVRDARSLMTQAEAGAYLIITRSQKAEVDLLGVGPPGSLERVERALVASPAFDVLYANRDATIFVLSERSARGS